MGRINTKVTASVVAVAVIAVGALGVYMYQSNDAEDTSNAVQTPPTTQPVQEGVIETVTPETADLLAIAPYSASGSATRVYEDGTFTHTATAKIGAPADGKFYEGWLVNSDGEFISTGKLEKAGDGTYMLRYETPNDMTTHSKVVITEETTANGLDNKPEAHVLEGDFS